MGTSGRGSSIPTIHPLIVQFSVPPQVDEIECIIPAYKGPCFEVSICIMKAERIRIVMLFKSLMLSLPLSISFLFPPVFLSATLSLSQSILIFFHFLIHFCHPYTAFLVHLLSLRRTRSHKHLLILFF